MSTVSGSATVNGHTLTTSASFTAPTASHAVVRVAHVTAWAVTATYTWNGQGWVRDTT